VLGDPPDRDDQEKLEPPFPDLPEVSVTGQERFGKLMGIIFSISLPHRIDLTHGLACECRVLRSLWPVLFRVEAKRDSRTSSQQPERCLQNPET
jgi:hypothetical protein